MIASSASSGIANQDPDHERNGDQEKKCDGGKEKKRRRSDEDKKRGAPNDGTQQPKRTKCRRPRPECYCNCGTVPRVRVYNVNDADTVWQMCQCNQCGPTQPGGGRRCVVKVNEAGVLFSRMMDGRVICMDCRGTFDD